MEKITNNQHQIFDKHTRLMYLKYARKHKESNPLKWFWELKLKEREYSFDEIALILQISKKEVISAYKSGIRTIRKNLTKRELHEEY